MELVTLQAVETLLSFSVFIGITLWAYSTRRKQAFDKLALLPFDDHHALSADTSTEHGHV